MLLTSICIFLHSGMPCYQTKRNEHLTSSNTMILDAPPSCVTELHTDCKVPLANMHLLQTCISLAVANPGHLDRGVPTDEDRRSLSKTLPEMAEEAVTTRKDAADGLNSWRLHPDGMTGMEKFEHMIEYRKKNAGD